MGPNAYSSAGQQQVQAILDSALASALRMSSAERRYLHVLAYGPSDASGPSAAASAPPELLDPAVAGLVQRLEPFPTLVKGRRWDVLAANPAACELFAGWSATWRTTWE